MRGFAAKTVSGRRFALLNDIHRNERTKMMIRLMTKLAVVGGVLAVGAMAGCASQVDGSAEMAAGAGDDEMYTITTVTQLADGTTEVTSSSISRKQQLENAARLRADKTEDPNLSGPPIAFLSQRAGIGTPNTGCPAQYLWLYDNVNQTGHEICFHTSPGASREIVDLANYCVFPDSQKFFPSCQRWVNSVHSFWGATDEDGLFYPLAVPSDCSGLTHINPSQRNDNFNGQVGHVGMKGANCL
jgi:hypothetical protein